MRSSKKETAYRKWQPDIPFDASSSRIERQTLTYDPLTDPNLSKSYRKKAARAREQKKDERSYTSTWEHEISLMAKKKASNTTQRQSTLSRLYCHNPSLYSRTWDLWPKALPYYPTTLGAGGADMNSIHRAMSITSSQIYVPCDSHLSAHSREYLEAMLRPGSAGGDQLHGKALGPAAHESLREMVSRRRLHATAIPPSPKRGLSGTSFRERDARGRTTLKDERMGHRIDYTSHAWLREMSFSGSEFNKEQGFNNAFYKSSPPTDKSLAAHAMTDNFTSPYTGKSIVDI